MCNFGLVYLLNINAVSFSLYLSSTSKVISNNEKFIKVFIFVFLKKKQSRLI